MIKDAITKLARRQDLTGEETAQVVKEMLAGRTSDEENIEFLSKLTEKGETDEELIGMLSTMDEFSLRFNPPNKDSIIDMCGTGGDGLQTFNVSTTASFVVAGAGGIVAKHGNRSNTGVAGSADIFEYFGFDLNQGPDTAAKMLAEFNICFMYAPKFHPAMKRVATARKKIGKRTAFNLLGPLSNPAGVKRQLVGVSSTEFLERIPLILKNRGAISVMTVRADNGMDEFSTNAINRICFLREGKIITNAIDPQVLGLRQSSIKDITIKSKEEAAKAFISVLNNSANTAMIETTALNAAGGLVVANIVKNFDEGIELALETIKSEKAATLFERMVEKHGSPAKLKEVQER